ncbi:MAG: serine/threonine-protein kinase [Polyangiaceae bacterium]
MGEAAKGFSSAPALSVPRVLGRRLLLKLAARGGMGDVYLGATTGIEGAERPCIVKTVRRDHIHDGSFLARFLDEARVQSQLQHPGVAQVLEAATDEQGEPYTVIEYVEGRSLGDVRQRSVQTGQRIAWPDAVAIAIEIAQALAHVHERPGPDGSPLGIVHRDLSPQNVMVSYAGEIKLIDFGTARGHNRRCHTVAGVVFAKPGYVAPEVARQEVGDGRIDVYALGIVLWELCAGRRLIATDPRRHLDDAAADKVRIPLVGPVCSGPPELDEIISKLTRNDPDDRYARASLAACDLARLLASAPPDGGERGVRARIARVMRQLWPHEPARSRAEFAHLLREARVALKHDAAGPETPRAGPVSEAMAVRMSPNDPSMLAGTPYRIGRKLGEGANGIVFEAEHTELGRRVAVKILCPENAGSPASLARFRREARAVANLSHPGIVQLYDFGKALDGRAFLAMELCRGQTLDLELCNGPLPWRKAVRIAIETASALEAAHGAGVIHRDIKPQNLMLCDTAMDEPHVKLLDFGIATALAQTDFQPDSAYDRASRGFSVLGTPEYMSPEQVAGEPVDCRSDLYALGCVLYEMLTGIRAFDGPTVEVMSKQLRETPLPPRSRAPSRPIPRGVEAVVVRAMAKPRTSRFDSASEMRAALQSALHAPERRRERLRNCATAILSAAAMLVAAAAASRWERALAPSADDGRRAMTRTPAIDLAAAAPPNASTSPASLAPASSSMRAVEEGAFELRSAHPPPSTVRDGDDSRTPPGGEERHTLGRWAKPGGSRTGKMTVSL